MKKYILILLVSTAILSCNKRVDYYDNIETAVGIGISGRTNWWSFSDGFEPNLIDSLKRSNSYSILTEVISDKAIKGVRVSKPALGKVLRNGKEIKYDEYLDLNKLDSLTYKPKIVGTETIRFTTTNVYDKSSVANLQLVVFNNLPPVAQLDIIHIDNLNDLEYQFDASTSFDLDSKFGGYIVQYKFVIDFDTILFPSSKMSYIFPAPGDYTITASCMDNGKLWSEFTNLEVFTVQ